MKGQKRRHDRAGRVLETGRFRYRYDACGRVIEKTENKAGYRPQVTRFSWNADDRLTHIELPNGTRYRYRYDPFGRRIAKECAHSQTQTHYQWDGAHIVQQQQATADGQVLQQTEYLYEPGSFHPMAQVTHHEQGSELHYIVTDHAGTPQELCNEQGDIVWRGEQALWGHYHGQSQRHWQRREEAANDSIQCDLRYQGQLEDAESGLYYNVNRYYDADSGQYLSPDPIGFAGGLRPQAYVANPLEWVDPLGLTPLNQGGFSVYGLYDQGATKPYYVGISNDPIRRIDEHVNTGRLNLATGQMRVLQQDLDYAQARGYEQAYIEKYGTKTGKIGENISSANRGNKIKSFDKARKDERGKVFNQEYEAAHVEINSKKPLKYG